MITLSREVTLMNRKVITDLALRTGYATPDDFSTGLGRNYLVNKFVKNPYDVEIPIEMLFENEDDYNADVYQPIYDSSVDEADIVDGEDRANTVAYNPFKDKLDSAPYLRRIEDINPWYFNKYVGNVCHNISVGSSSFRGYAESHIVQPTLTNSSGDDPDDFTELSDLAVEENDDWSLEVKDNASCNLSYVLRRLHNMSCITGMHMLSYIRAYVCASDRNKRKRLSGSQKTLTCNDVIREGVYTCDNKGNVKKQVTVESKNRIARAMFDWITKTTDNLQSYYVDYENLLHYCDVLSIDIVHDDMSKYGSDFIDSLVVTVVTPNSQYNAQIYQALLNHNKEIKTVKEEVNIVQKTMQFFSDAMSSDTEIRRAYENITDEAVRNSHNTAMGILNLYCINKGIPIILPEQVQWVRGWLCQKGKLIQLPCNILGDTSRNGYTCIVNELGYVVCVTGEDRVVYMSLADAYQNCQNIFASSVLTDFKFLTWKAIL